MERLPSDTHAERNLRPNVSDLDPVRLYLDEAGKTPLLTREQEREIGISIVEGRAALEQLQTAEAGGLALEPAEQASLQALVQAGEAGREHMFAANLLLVVSIARKFRKPHGMDLMDLIQEGNLGLHHAVDMFDPYKGFKFSTYATWWIRQAIRRSIQRQGSMLAASSGVSQLIDSLSWHEDHRMMDSGHVPDDEVLSQELGISKQRLGDIRRARDMQYTSMELDRPLGAEGSSVSYGDLVADKRAAVDFEKADDRLQAASLIEELERLCKDQVITPDDLAIIKLHCDDMPVKKIAEILELEEHGAAWHLHRAISKARFGLAGVKIPEGRLTASSRQELNRQMEVALKQKRQEYSA